jgi:hypothetical protein
MATVVKRKEATRSAILLGVNPLEAMTIFTGSILQHQYWHNIYLMKHAER